MENFECKDLGDLHDIYLKVDVMLLSAVFENFRDTCVDHFNIDPCHYVSAPGLSWAAALKKTSIKLERIKDIDMLLMVEKGIRGGVTTVSKRYSRANFPGMNEYDPFKQDNHILYFDVNNLYGYAMSQPLPVGSFEWINVVGVDIQQVLNISNSDIGMILEVDLHYPIELHDTHNDFPLAPESRQVQEDQLSNYQKDLIQKMKEKGCKYTKSTKLITSLCDKKNYVIHIDTLKFYLSKGMVIQKIHRAFIFNQSPWLSSYVEFCTKMRQESTTDFQKDFWKLMVNSIYGKTIENKRKYKNVEISFSGLVAERRLRHPACSRFKIIGDKYVIFEKKPSQIYMDKPIAVGFSVLELAKLKMYELHYDKFKSYYGDNIELVYTDTDSLIYDIKTNSLLQDLEYFADIMDFSNYPEDHPLHSKRNCRKIGFLKDEMGGKQIFEFVGLKAKLYALRTSDGEKKRAKGTQKAVVEKKIKFDHYLSCLNDETIHVENQSRIGSDNHQIHMYSTEKNVMSPLDDKRFLLNDKISSYAFGHYKCFQ